MSGGKREVELFDARARRKAKGRKPSIVTVVFIVAVLALASLSVALGGLAQHYHDSKYRSQYWLVVSLSNSIASSRSGIDNSVRSSSPLDERVASSVYAEAHLAEAKDLSYSLQLMYEEGSKESDAFDAVHQALDVTGMVMWRIEDRLGDWQTTNISNEFNISAASSLGNITDLMVDLGGLVYAGVDESRDFIESPYSLVKRMDLDAIAQVSSKILAISIELSHWMTS